MANPLTYTQADFVGSTPINSVDPEQLRQELVAAVFASTPVTFDRVDIQRAGADFDVQVYFSGVPDATDETAVDVLIAAHTATGATDPPPTQAKIDSLVATLDTNPNMIHADVSGAVVLSWQRLDHTIDLTGNLGIGDIDFSELPDAGVVRQITIEIIQDGVGGHTIAADAWTGVDWGDVGAPVFGEDANKSRIVVIYCNGTKLLGFANSSVFGP